MVRRVLREILFEHRERYGGRWVGRGTRTAGTDDVANAAAFPPNPPGVVSEFREVDAAAVFRGELQAARERVEALAERLGEVDRL